MKNIVLFASGSGSNAENICRYFEQHPDIRVVALFCNKPGAFVLERMQKRGIPCHVFNRATFQNEAQFSEILKPYQADLLVLAGFLWLVPAWLIQQFPNKIINIHPALLPKFGGKGMHGMHVHEAVKAAGETESGITIHLVNENYDEGKTLFQASTHLIETDTPELIAEKIHRLEMDHFPAVIETFLNT